MSSDFKPKFTTTKQSPAFYGSWGVVAAYFETYRFLGSGTSLSPGFSQMFLCSGSTLPHILKWWRRT